MFGISNGLANIAGFAAPAIAAKITQDTVSTIFTYKVSLNSFSLMNFPTKLVAAPYVRSVGHVCAYLYS